MSTQTYFPIHNAQIKQTHLPLYQSEIHLLIFLKTIFTTACHIEISCICSVRGPQDEIEVTV